MCLSVDILQLHDYFKRQHSSYKSTVLGLTKGSFGIIVIDLTIVIALRTQWDVSKAKVIPVSLSYIWKAPFLLSNH